jgi:outer membrane protein
MKRNLSALLTILFVAICGFSVQAQTAKKIGHVNTSEIIKGMPDAANADSALAKYEKELASELEKMVNDYKAKLKEYQDKYEGWSDAMRRVKEEELQEMQQRIQSTQQAFEQEMVEKQQKLYTPIKEKIDNAVKEVAKEMGYAYVMDLSMGGWIVYDEGDNLNGAVRKKLGLK